MSADDSDTAEDELASLLAACDDALAAGAPPERTDAPPSASALHERLQRGVACMKLLRHVLPPTAPERTAAPPLRTLGRYEIRRELGRGGFGVVLLAYDPQLRREVALKVPRAEGALLPELRQRFVREARAAAGLDHPNLVAVYEAGEIGAVCYIASAYCPGPTLAGWLKQQAGPVPFHAAAELLATLAEAVQHAHDRGVLHRDLKPSNILLSRIKDGGSRIEESRSTLEPPSSILDLRSSTPRITDFGLAKLLLADESVAQTQSQAVLGTPQYMAPEQALGGSKAAGPPADVYALGAILYELLTGRPPFQGEAALDVLEQVRSLEPVAPSRLRPRLPRDLETICLKCLRKEPHRRYATPRALAEDLRRFLDGRSIVARPVGAVERLGRWCRRNPALATAGGVAAALLVAVTGLSIAFAVYQSNTVEELEAAAGKLRDQQQQTEQALEDAREQTKEVKRQAIKAREQAALQMLERGLNLCEQHELTEGMWWLVRGLKEAPDEAPGLQRAIRGQLGSWRPYLFPLKGILAPATGPRQDRDLAVAISPDGRTVATGDADQAARLWDFDTGKRLGPPLQHQGLVRALAFSPDGRLLASAGDDHTARLWEVATGKTVGPPLQHGATVQAVAFSPKGDMILTGSRDRTAQLWDVATGEPRGAPLRHSGPVGPVAFSADGSTVVTRVASGTYTWDAATGKPQGPAQTWPPGGVWLSPDGRLVVTARDKTTREVHDRATGALVGFTLPHRGTVFAVAFSADGRTVLTGCDDKMARLWDVPSGRLIGPLLHHTDQVVAVAVSDDGRRLVSSGGLPLTRLWEASAARPVPRVLLHKRSAEAIAYSSDGRLVVIGSYMENAARLWDVATGQPLGPPLGQPAKPSAKPAPLVPLSVAFSPDDRFVLTGSNDTTARLWDVETGELRVPPLPHPNPVRAVAYSPTGQTIATVSGNIVPGEGKAWLWNAATGEPLGPPLVHPRRSDDVAAVAFSPDGQTVATGGGTIVQLWQVATGKPLGPPLVHDAPRVYAVAFSPDGRLLATRQSDRAQLWDIATGQPVAPPLRHNDHVPTMTFSRDGRTFATGSSDRTARLWDTATGKPLGAPLLHQGQVSAVAFSPDGHTLLSAGGLDGMGRLWDVATGKLLGMPLEHGVAVATAVFSPDGRTVLTANMGRVALWPVPQPMLGRVQDIALWLAVCTGTEMDEHGSIHVLDAAAWQQRREEFAKVAAVFTP
jgi:WD40 repeat protein